MVKSAAVVNLDTNTDGVFMDKKKKNSWLQTATGRRVSVLDPQPEEIFIEDIYPAISKQCRFNGHCDIFYSVAQHCVLGSELAEEWYSKDIAKEFLLHDATEAYMGDLIRPVKVMIPEFGTVEARFWRAISNKFNLSYEHTKECQYLDNVMVTWEKRDMLPNSETWPNLPDITPMKLPKIQSWSWQNAEWEWKERYKKLFLE